MAPTAAFVHEPRGDGDVGFCVEYRRFHIGPEGSILPVAGQVLEETGCARCCVDGIGTT